MAEPATQELEVAVNDRGRVHMLDRSGRAVTVDEKDLDQAIQAGFQPETADSVERRRVEREYGDIGSKAAAFAEGALEDATFGLGTAGLAAIMGDDYREDARLREQVNPGTHMAGKVFGSVAPVLASGGSSAVARGLATVGAPARAVTAAGTLAERGVMGGLRALGYEGTSVLGRAGAKALSIGAAGAVEGAGFGLSGSIADAALEDTEWTAERALSAMSDGAMYGLGAGATVGGASSLLGSAGKAALSRMTEGKTFKQAAGEFAEKRAAKSLIGNNARIYNELTNFGEDFTRVKRMGRKALDADIPLTDLNAGIRALEKKTGEAAGDLKAVASELDAAGVRVDARKVIETVDAQIADLRRVPLKSHQDVAAKLEAEIAPIRDAIAPRDVPAVKRTPGERSRVEFTEKPGQEFTFSDWWKLRQQFDQTLNWAKRSGDPATDNLRKLRQQLDSGLDDAIARHTDEQAKKLAVDGDNAGEAMQVGDLGLKWKQAKEDYGDFVSLKEAAEEQATRAEKNRWISPSDYGVGGAGGNVLGLAAGIATGNVGIGALTGMAAGAAGSVVHKFIRERGAGWLAKAADSIAHFDARTTRAARVLAGLEHALTPSRLVTRGAIKRKQSKDRQERFKDALDHVQKFTRDPAYAAAETEKVIAPLAREQPEVASKMAARYQGDMAYLAAKAPKPSGPGAKSWQPLKSPTFYGRADKESFVKIVEALADPAAAMEDIADGELDLDVIEALKERRPQAFADLRQKVMTYAAELEDEMPYTRRVFLSMAFDYEGDPSLSPDTIAAIQASTVEGATGEASKPGPNAHLDTQSITEAMSLPAQQAGV
jgi:hypothetical protein